MSIARLAVSDGLPRRIFVVSATVAFLLLLALGSATTFRVDDWDLVANRSLLDPASLVRPYNQQFIAVPIVIFRLIYAVVGLHSYLPYLAVLLALHIATATVVRHVVSEFAGEVPGLAAGILFLFLGSGYENLNAAFQIGQVIATGSGVLAMDLAIRHRRSRAAAVLFMVALASHAIGAAYLAGTIVAMLAFDRRRVAWMAIPLASLGMWTFAFDLGSLAARDEPIAAAIAAVPLFMVVGPIAAVAAVFGLSLAGGAILVAIGIGVARLERLRPAYPPLVIGAGVALIAEYALIAMSRAAFGIGATTWSRYVYSAVPLVLVFVAAYLGSISASWTKPARRRATMVLAGLTVIAVVGNLRTYASSVDFTSEYIQRVRAAAAIAAWSPAAGQLTSDPVMPSADRLRELFAASGSPAQDDLVPAVVTAVPSAMARQACVEMLGQGAALAPCMDAINKAVGANR